MELLEINEELKHDLKFEGFGTSLSWFAAGISDKNQADELCNILFNPNNPRGLHLNIVRYNIGGSNIYTKEMRIGGKIEEYGNMDWETVDQNQIYFLKKSMEHGATVFEAFSNTPPMGMTVSGQTSGADPWKIFKNKFGFSNNLIRDKVDDFTSYLVNVTNFLITQGIPFTSISPINEPSSPGWVNGNNQEGCFYGFSGIRRRVFESLYEKTRNLGIRVTGFEENNMLQAVLGLLINPFIKINKYNVHRYTIGDALGFDTKGFEDSNIFRRIIRNLVGKKPIWMSEIGFGYDNGVSDFNDVRNTLNFANKIIDDLIYLKPTAWVYWQVIEHLTGNGWGCLQVDFNNPSNRTYGSQFTAFQHFTHYIRPGNFILNMVQPKNKKIKWVSSLDPETGVKNLIVSSTDTTGIEVIFPKNTNILKKMESTGDHTSTIVFRSESNIGQSVIIKPMSVLSIQFK